MIDTGKYINRQELLAHLNECIAESDGNTPIVDATLKAIKCAVKQMQTFNLVMCKDCVRHEDEQPGMVYCPLTVGNWVPERFHCALAKGEDDGNSN